MSDHDLDPARLHAVEPHDPPWPARPDGWRHDFPDPPLAFPVPFGPLDGLALMGWAVIAQFVVLVPLLGAGAELDGNPVASLATILVIYVVTLVGSVGWLQARRVLSWRVLGPVRPRWGHLPLGIGLGVVGWIIVTLLVLLVLSLAGITEVDQQQVLDDVRDGGTAGVVLTVVTVGFLGPIVEELIYRAVLFQALRRRIGLFPGMALSSVAFAAAHVELYSEPTYLLALVVFGAWLAAIMHRTGSIVVPVVAHGAFNLVQVAIALTVASG